MAASSLDHVWQLMSQHAFEAYPNIATQDLTCGICKKLMVDCYTTHCECRYCRVCIHEYANDRDTYCCGNKDDCQKEYLVLNENVWQSPAVNRRILKLEVRCPNRSCGFSAELQNMGGHLVVCSHATSSCPFTQIGCEMEEAPNDVISTHLQNDIFVHSELLIDLFHNLKNEVVGLKANTDRSKLEMNNLIEDSVIKDRQWRELCGNMEKWKREMGAQMNEKDGRIDGNMEKMRIRLQTLENELREVKGRLNLALCTVEDLKREGEAGTVVDRGAIGGVKMEIDAERMKRKEVKKKRMNNLIMFCLKINTDFVWKIDDWKKKMETTRQTRKFIYSESFYSNNYNLRLAIGPYFLHEDDINIYCSILRGDNDHVVKWPMKHHVTLSIVNQDTLASHKSVTLHRDTYRHDRSAFDMPKNDSNDNCIMAYSFIKLSCIEDDPSVCPDDSIIVSCVLRYRP